MYCTVLGLRLQVAPKETKTNKMFPKKFGDVFLNN